RIRNPVQQMQEYQRFINQLQQDIARDTSLQKLFNVVTERKDFNLKALDTVVTRWQKLPLVYDDKGQVKEYTEKEKKERKGKAPKLPGDTAEWKDVEVGQEVKVTVTSKKSTAAKDKKDPDKKDADKKDPDKDKKDADKEKKDPDKDKKE